MSVAAACAFPLAFGLTLHFLLAASGRFTGPSDHQRADPVSSAGWK